MIEDKHISEVHNEDCMIGMARYPDKWFDCKNISLDFAFVTSNYVSLRYETIERITSWEGWRIHCLCRFNHKRLCSLSIRTRVALRRFVRHWSQSFACSGKNNIMPKRSGSEGKNFKGIYFQHKACWEKQQSCFLKWGCGFVCACLFRYAKSWLCVTREFANDNKSSCGQSERYILRRKRNNGSFEGIGHENNHVANTDCKRTGLARCSRKSNGAGGLQTV